MLRKIAQTAGSVGLEHSPIEHGKEGYQFFADTREEIERLLRNVSDLYEKGGPESALQSPEEYRQALREALETPLGDKMKTLRPKAGSGMAKGKRKGHLFCAKAGDRIFLRFVPFDSQQPIEHEEATCLRMIECNKDSARVMPDDLKQSVFDAWERARRDILTRETVRANLQPRRSPLREKLASFLRHHTPRSIDQCRFEKCLDAVEGLCPGRDERRLREVFRQEFESDEAKSEAIVKEVERLGLQPPPKPLPPITEEQIHLVCWMALEQ